jgi:hypothetical protein
VARRTERASGVTRGRRLPREVGVAVGAQWELPGGVGAQWELPGACGAHRPAVSSSFTCPAGTRRPTPAPFADLRARPFRLLFEPELAAAVPHRGTRHETANPSGLRPASSRGGGIAERCAGVLPKYISACVAPPRAWPKRTHEGLPSGQNARLRAGIEKETEGATLVSTRQSLRRFPLHPYNRRLQPPRLSLVPRHALADGVLCPQPSAFTCLENWG